MAFKEPSFQSAPDSMEANIAQHVHDKTPEGVGNKDILARLKGANFGCEKVNIGRPDPDIKIDALVLEKGCSKVLVGPNGSGKSTIFDAIEGGEGSDAYFDTKDGRGGYSYGVSVHYRGDLRISRLSQEESLEAIQDMPAGEVLDQAVERFKAEVPVNWEDMDKYEQNLANEAANQRIEELRDRIISLFDMEEYLDRPVADLSGGEKTKLAIFQVLLSEPDVLLLDEPTNHLDLESIAKLTTLFKMYNEAGVAVLSVSHVGWFLEEASKDGVIEVQFDDDSRHVVSSNSTYDKHIKNKTRPEFTVIDEKLGWKNYENLRDGTYLTMHGGAGSITVPESPLQDITLDSLKVGEVWVLSGKNGTGKTKLMDAMADPETRRGVFDKAKGVNIAYMPQFWPEEVQRGNLDNFFQYVKDQINPLEQEVNFKHFTDAIKRIGFMRAGESNSRIDRSWLSRPLGSFSGGEQRLLWFLATSCFKDVDCLILDEPTNHMDPNLQKFVTEAIRDFPGAVVLSTHDIKLLEEISADIGEKVGGNMAARNVVLEKEDNLTSVSMSDQSPVEYMKEQMTLARKAAKKFKI
jgi:ATP-binding cassette, subfamily F, member 3